MAGVAYPGGGVGDGVKDLLDAVGDAGKLRPPRPGGRGRGRAGEVKQVLALGLVELQRRREPVEDGVGRAGEVPALHPDVVVDAHAGQQRDLLAA